VYLGPFPDESRERHYLDVFNTQKTNEDDFLPRAQVKKLYAKGELHSSDKAKLAELSKQLCVAENLLEDSVKHCEQLQVLSEMRSTIKKNNKLKTCTNSWDSKFSVFEMST